MRGRPRPHVSTPPKAGPGTAGILPARLRAPRHYRGGRGRCALPARLHPAEGGARDRGHPARTSPRAAALPGRARSLRPACTPPPRRRRGPGPRASCPHVSARRGVTGEGAVIAPRPSALPGCAGILPARLRAPRRYRGGRGRCPPPERASWVRGRSRPHVSARRGVTGEGAVVAPRTHASTPPKAGPGCAGVPARTFARDAMSASKRAHVAAAPGANMRAGTPGARKVRAADPEKVTPPPPHRRAAAAASG